MVIRQFASAAHRRGQRLCEVSSSAGKIMPTTETGSAAEFLEYLDYFVQAKGSTISLPRSKEDGVHLMTAHAAKGLEFGHVADSARFVDFVPVPL